MRPQSHVQCKAKVSSSITAVTSVMVGSNYTALLLCGDSCVKTDAVDWKGPLARVPWVPIRNLAHWSD